MNLCIVSNTKNVTHTFVLWNIIENQKCCFHFSVIKSIFIIRDQSLSHFDCSMAFLSHGTGRKKGMLLVVWMVVCYVYLSNTVYLDKVYSMMVEQTSSSDGPISFFNILKTKAASANKLLLPNKEPPRYANFVVSHVLNTFGGST